MATDTSSFTDLYYAAWLELHRIPVNLRKQSNGKVIFEAPAAQEYSTTIIPRIAPVMATRPMPRSAFPGVFYGSHGGRQNAEQR